MIMNYFYSLAKQKIKIQVKIIMICILWLCEITNKNLLKI